MILIAIWDGSFLVTSIVDVKSSYQSSLFCGFALSNVVVQFDLRSVGDAVHNSNFRVYVDCDTFQPWVYSSCSQVALLVCMASTGCRSSGEQGMAPVLGFGSTVVCLCSLVSSDRLTRILDGPVT